MQNVAQAWLVYRLTESGFFLGLASFCALSPMLLFGLLGGGLADRYSPHKLLVVSQSLAMLQALALAALTLAGAVEIWHILALAFFLGVTQSVQIPARHAFIASLVPKDHLANAVALNSTAFNTARFLGPAVAGALVAVTNEGVVFLLNALTFMVYLYAMSVIVPVARKGLRTRPRLRDGFAHAARTPRIRAALLMVALVGLVAGTYVVLMPIFAKEVFGGGAETLGILMGMAGGGSLAAALALAARDDSGELDRMIGAAGLAGGSALLVFSQVSSVAAAVVIVPIIGFSLTTIVVGSNTLIQLQVPDELRGRVMSIFSVTFLGLTPLGNLIAGSAAEVAGAASTVLIYGLACSLAAALFLMFVLRTTPAARGQSDL